jgi:hypothetical protein
METLPKPTTQPALQIPLWVALCVSLAIATSFLWDQHRAHILGAVPYLLILACPFMHLFMHRGHGGHGGHGGHRLDE